MRQFSSRFALVLFLVVIVIGAVGAYQQGWHRMLLRYLYARMLQGEIVAPNTIRLPAGNSPYNRWVATNRTRIPMLEGMAVEDVTTQSLPPWPAMGVDVTGLYLRLADYQLTDGHLLQLPPGASTSKLSHRYEVGTYFFGGPGYTLFEVEGEAPQRIDWREGSLISIPLLASYQHFNISDNPVRLLSVSSFPFVLNAFDDEDFVRGVDYGISDSAAATTGFVTITEKTSTGEQSLNVVPNALTHPTVPNRSRGATNRSAYWQMAGNSMLEMHVSEFGPRSHKRAHRHSSDAFILILSGTGYSLAWAEGNFENRLRIDWRPGTLFVPPNYWYHQHFNTSFEPARYLVINSPTLVKHMGLRFYNQLDLDSMEIRAEWDRALESGVANTRTTVTGDQSQ